MDVCVYLNYRSQNTEAEELLGLEHVTLVTEVVWACEHENYGDLVKQCI